MENEEKDTLRVIVCRPMNRAIQDENGKVLDIIAGPFFICYAPIESEKFLSLPKDLEEKFLKNANGPGNTWENNGPQVNENIKHHAGIKK